MTKTRRVDAVEMTRRIRDAHHEQLRAKSAEEQIEFYRAKARRLQAELAAERHEQPAGELQHA